MTTQLKLHKYFQWNISLSATYNLHFTGCHTDSWSRSHIDNWSKKNLLILHTKAYTSSGSPVSAHFLWELSQHRPPSLVGISLLFWRYEEQHTAFGVLEKAELEEGLQVYGEEHPRLCKNHGATCAIPQAASHTWAILQCYTNCSSAVEVAFLIREFVALDMIYCNFEW